MAIVTSGLTHEGKPATYGLDDYMKENLDAVKERVENGKWDNKIIIAGYSGVGKSHTVQYFAKYLDPNFTADNYCFSIDEFIEKASTCPPYTAIVLDESFDSMNSKASLSKEFQKVISFLQIIRQKNLYIFLLLPNFFDLQKSVALYNTNLLIVAYTDERGKRGRYAVFDRDRKKNLYIRGYKMMNYSAEKPNFRGKVPVTCVIDWARYEEKKKEHLLQQMKQDEHEQKSRPSRERDRAICYLKEIVGLSVERIMDITRMPQRTVYDSINRQKEFILKKFKPEELEGGDDE